MILNGQLFNLGDTYGDLDTETLSYHIGIEVSGLIDVDILNKFNILFDLSFEVIRLSKEELLMEGTAVPMNQFMGIPVIEVEINGVMQKMFFDTGAQISYWQDAALGIFPSNGKVTDFYPGFSEFETETYRLELSVGDKKNNLICGSLPALRDDTLMMAIVTGIIGNEIMRDRTTGYFPAKQQLVIG